MPVSVAPPSAAATYQHLFLRGAMPIAFECPKCKKEQRAHDHLVNRELKCAKCGSLFKVPAIGTGTPPARFVQDLYSGPKKAPVKPAAPVAVPLSPSPLGVPAPPAARPLPAAAAAFEQELVLSEDMIVSEPAKPGAAPEPIMELTDDMIVEETPGKKPAKAGPGKAAEEELLLTEDMVVEEGPSANAPASPADLDLLDEIIMEETAPPKPPTPPKKK
jgi:hypothetical protein